MWQLSSQCQESHWWITAQNAHTTWWSWRQLTPSTPFLHHSKMKCAWLFCLCLRRPGASCSLHILRMTLSHPLQECTRCRKNASIPGKHCERRGQWENFQLTNSKSVYTLLYVPSFKSNQSTHLEKHSYVENLIHRNLASSWDYMLVWNVLFGGSSLTRKSFVLVQLSASAADIYLPCPITLCSPRLQLALFMK